MNTLVRLDPWWGWWNYRHHHLEQLQLCPKSKLDLDCLVLQQWNPRHKNWLHPFLSVGRYPHFLLFFKNVQYCLKIEERIIQVFYHFFFVELFSKGRWKQTVKTTPNIVYASKWWGHDFVSHKGLMYILFETMPKIIEKFMVHILHMY